MHVTNITTNAKLTETMCDEKRVALAHAGWALAAVGETADITISGFELSVVQTGVAYDSKGREYGWYKLN